MTRCRFSTEEQQALDRERFAHPHPRVQRRLEVLWLVSQGLVYSEAARLGGVSDATVDRYVTAYRRGGIDVLREIKWSGNSVSELWEHRESLEESFRRNPPHTVAEARQRIQDETGIERGLTQVRVFLKKLWA